MLCTEGSENSKALPQEGAVQWPPCYHFVNISTFSLLGGDGRYLHVICHIY